MPDDFMTDYRARMLWAMDMPRKVTKSKADLYRRLSESAIKRAHELGRPPYLDPRGFTDDKWLLRGEKEVFTSRARATVCGHEKPYGWPSRPFWREMWKAVKYASLSAFADATDATYETTEGGRNYAVITGLTA